MFAEEQEIYRRSWSKDYVEHLRATHFVLLAISIGVMTLASASDRFDSKVALLQLEQLTGLKREWSPGWVKSHVSLVQEELEPGAEERPFRDCLNEVIIVNRPTGSLISQRYRLMMPADPWKLMSVALDDDENDPNEWSPEFPRTIASFSSWWNQLLTPVKLQEPEMIENFVTISGNRYYFTCAGNVVKNSDDIRNLEVSIRGRNIYAWNARDHENIIIRVTKRSTFKISQEALLQGSNLTRMGLFNAVFPDLQRATEGMGSLNIEDIRSHVERSASRDDRLEAFGIRFPAARISFWGIMLVISVQLYFVIYLKQRFGTLQPDDEGYDVPWIGIDQSLLAKVIFAISGVIPLLAILMLNFQSLVINRHQSLLPWRWYWSFEWTVAKTIGLAITLVSGYLSWCSIYYRPRIQSGMTMRAQLFE